MADRIIAMREKLYNLLIELKTPGEWGHIKSQIGTSIAPLYFLFLFFFAILTECLGMFSFTGISKEQVEDLAEYAHVYMTKDGRISMAGLNEHNIRYFAESLSKVVKGELRTKSAL